MNLAPNVLIPTMRMSSRGTAFMEAASMPTYEKSMIFDRYHSELTIRTSSLEREAHGR
jgi:hypothetical protein